MPDRPGQEPGIPRRTRFRNGPSRTAGQEPSSRARCRPNASSPRDPRRPGVSYLGSVRGYLAQRDELGRQQVALTALNAERDRIRARLEALDDPEVAEARARELGYVEVGEMPIRVTGLELAPPAAPPRRTAAAASGAGSPTSSDADAVVRLLGRTAVHAVPGGGALPVRRAGGDRERAAGPEGATVPHPLLADLPGARRRRSAGSRRPGACGRWKATCRCATRSRPRNRRTPACTTATASAGSAQGAGSSASTRSWPSRWPPEGARSATGSWPGSQPAAGALLRRRDPEPDA